MPLERPELLVRQALVADAESIAETHIASWQVAYAHVFATEALRELTDLAERRTEFWRRTIEAGDPRTHTLVAETEGRIVGFANLCPSRDDDAEPDRTGELLAIYVAPDAWGSGAGRALMEHALERLRASGFEEATLWVLEDNPRARRFYEAAGWTPDEATKDDVFLGTPVREVRYRKSL